MAERPLPPVALLMATNRPQFFDNAYDQYLKQDYGPAHLEIDAEPGSHGMKMDMLIRACSDKFFVVFDDDDLYAKDRVSKLIQPMLDSDNVDCVGTSLVYYVDERKQKAWLYDNVKLMQSWKANSGLFWLAAPAYRRSTYDKYGPWLDRKCGADLAFLHRIPRERVVDLRDPNLMICRLHEANAAPKEPHPPAWTEISMSEVPKL